MQTTDFPMRINKFVARATGTSRREADEWIAKGLVALNGQSAEMGQRVAESDQVTLRGQELNLASNFIYLMLNKPTGYVCSRRRQGETPTIYELLPHKYRSLKPVGRLDKDSSGLILMTDDGDFAHRMTHPKFHKIKVYEVELDKPLEPLHQQMISDHGVQLEDGISQFLVSSHDTYSPKSKIQNLSSSNTYKVTMSEGRNRQIRRTFAALGYTVIKLHRTHFGNYTLGDIKVGEHKFVDIL